MELVNWVKWESVPEGFERSTGSTCASQMGQINHVGQVLSRQQLGGSVGHVGQVGRLVHWEGKWAT